MVVAIIAMTTRNPLGFVVHLFVSKHETGGNDMNMEPQTMEYRLIEPPTQSQIEQMEHWNRAHGDCFGVTLRYEMREEMRDTYYGRRPVEVWYFIVHHDPSRSGVQPPKIGRPPKVLPPADVIRQRQKEGRSMAAMAREYGVTRATLYRHLSRENAVDDTPGDVV